MIEQPNDRAECASEVEGEHRWSELDPLIKFAIVSGVILFLGVVIEGILLFPWSLLEYGWTPAPR